MSRKVKLGILLLLSLSVYFIYAQTKDSSYTITSIGDNSSIGINSYGIKEYSYIDYIKEEYEKEKDKVVLNKQLNQKDQSIKETLNSLKNTPNMKRVLYDTNLLILTLGQNDLFYKISIEDNMNPQKLEKIVEDIDKDYQELIEEIRKYYHNSIIVIGYDNKQEYYYQAKGIDLLNKVLEKNPEIIYINREKILKEDKKYFSNSHSKYPNRYGYQRIAQEIIQKTLENKENI